MENLDKALAKLTEKLGVGAEGFMEWLTNGGLESYTRMQVLQNACMSVALVVLFIIAFTIALKAYKINKDKHDYYRDETADVIMMISGFCGFILFLIMMSCLSETLCWIVAPEGKVLEMLLKLLG